MVLATFLGMGGCNEAAPQKFQVTGVVTFDKQPLAEGTITFEDSNTGVADAFDIEPNGTYTASVPNGDYGVSIQPPMIMIQDSANSEGGEQFKKVDNIPGRYWSAYESGLKVSVTEDTTFDVNMGKARK